MHLVNVTGKGHRMNGIKTLIQERIIRIEEFELSSGLIVVQRIAKESLIN